MSSQQVKIKWPFKKGEKARLIWIGDPFRNNNKMMLHAYFRARGVTEKILMDWVTLPCLAIQHNYGVGVITTGKLHKGVREVVITFYPNQVQYYEKLWNVNERNDLAPSLIFLFLFKAKMMIC